jgi:DNA-binding transcriptional regulator PaaX
MQKQALVKITDNNDGSYQITLTKKGQTRSSRVRFEQLQIPEEKWDEKWRVFMFDIPEQYKTTRDYISRHMRQVGFK